MFLISFLLSLNILAEKVSHASKAEIDRTGDLDTRQERFFVRIMLVALPSSHSAAE